MTKEEFMKNALGAQYSENESGLLDKVAKKNLGAQYTESEMKAMSNPLLPLINGEPPFVAQFRNPMGVMDLTQEETSDTPWREETDNLTKTAFESQYGFPIYENEFGAPMSEQSTTIPFGGQFLNFRTIIDGQKLDDRSVMNLFFNGQLEPTSVHKTLEEAIESAKIRSKGIKHMLPVGTYARDNEGDMYTGENTPTKNFSNLGFN